MQSSLHAKDILLRSDEILLKYNVDIMRKFLELSHELKGKAFKCKGKTGKIVNLSFRKIYVQWEGDDTKKGLEAIDMTDQNANQLLALIQR